MSMSRSPLSGLSYDQVVPAIGDANKLYTITLANPNTPGSSFIHGFTRCLLSLPIFYRNVECRIDDAFLSSLIPNPSMCKKKNSKHWGPEHFFAINNSAFLCLNTDHPSYGIDKWLPLYQRYLRAVFVLQYRDSTQHLFQASSIPIIPLPCKPDEKVINIPFELDLHSRSITCEKDISVFFHGRNTIRPARKKAGKRIQRAFSDSFIKYLDHGQSCLSSEDYFDAMCRSKIVWCPRSAWEDPDHDCNGVTGREIEAMCLEIMIVRNPLGIREKERRIPGVHFVEVDNENENLIPTLQYYLEHEDERQQIARNGRLYWERNHSTIARAQHLIQTCLDITES